MCVDLRVLDIVGEVIAAAVHSSPVEVVVHPAKLLVLQAALIDTSNWLCFTLKIKIDKL